MPRAARSTWATATPASCSPGLHKAGLDVAWGPMPQDVLRDGGEAAVSRALDWLVRRDPAALEPALERPAMAFNLTVLSNLLGTPLEPDFTGVDLLIEDVGEQLYRIDRTMFHVTASANDPEGRAGCGSAGSRDILANDPEFATDEAAIVEEWCARSGIPFGGRADIGHDAAEPGRSVRRAEIADHFPLQQHCKAPRFALYPREEQQEGLMAQGTVVKQGADWPARFNLRRISPRSPAALRCRAARSFRRCGTTSARTTCKTRKTNGKSWRTTS